MRLDFNDEYKIAKVLYIQNELERLPNVHRAGGSAAVRIYSPEGRVLHTYKLNRAKNIKYGQIADRRVMLNSLRKQILSALNVNPNEYHIQITSLYKIGGKEWEQMKSSSNNRPIDSDYWFDGIHMRSRFELNTATVLKTLGLEFKYEPRLVIGGKEIHPDFVVRLPEFQVCFVIECMGRIGNNSYDHDAVNRLKLLMDGGFIPYRDFLVLGGSEKFIPSEEWISNAIVSIVNAIASEFVFRVSTDVKRLPRAYAQESIEERIARGFK